jgi:hypothetical protein
LRALQIALAYNPDIHADTLAKKVDAGEVHFTIDLLSSGDIKDIANRNFTDLVTMQASTILNIGLIQSSYVEDGKPPVADWNADLSWQQGPELSWLPGLVADVKWDNPVKEVFAMSKNLRSYKRYAAVTVMVSYLGRSRTYNSLWLFDGVDPVLPVDFVTGHSDLSTFYKRAVVPTTLLETKSMGSNPAVRQWLQTHQLPDAACKSTEAACCLPETMQCGVTASAVSRALAKYPEQLKKESTQTGTLNPPSTSSTRP